MMNMLQKVNDLCSVRDISKYRLSQLSDISQSAFSKMKRQQSTLTIGSIERICDAFGITVAQFFSEDSSTQSLTEEQAQLLQIWLRLDSRKRSYALRLLENLLEL
ncbi:MAG: helix-turn-helix transcriptional regulator [Clostridiales bacterium]|nr:helix-turn-helix transcriptional regulator [Clostridiales bacterium]